MMDEARARTLLHPLVEGAPLAEGVTLAAIEVVQSDTDVRDDAIHLVLSAELRVVLSPRSERPAAFRTRGLDVTVQRAGDLSPAERRAIDALRQRLVANEDRQPAPAAPPSLGSQQPASRGAQLWLIPGHIGSPLDLSLRALRVLGRTQRLFTEPGTQRRLLDLFEQHGLGRLPEVVELSIDDAALEASLADGAARGLTMALFGVDEGLPGLCDPGWRVLAALPAVTAPVRLRSISSGSALSTALLYRDRPAGELRFLGLLENAGGHSPLWSHLEQARRSLLHTAPTAVCFARGEQVRAVWPRLIRASRRLDGRLSLLCNLSRADERVDRFALSELGGVDLSSLDDLDKVVLQIDFDPPLLERVGDRVRGWTRQRRR